MKSERERLSADFNGVELLEKGQEDTFSYEDSHYMCFDKDESYEEGEFEIKGGMENWTNPSLIDDLKQVKDLKRKAKDVLSIKDIK